MIGRFNKLTEGVFTGIARTNSQISKVEVFSNFGDYMEYSNRLKYYTDKYRKYTTLLSLEIDYLAKLERVILQIRSSENMDDIKLSILREYIYARVPFYRTDRSTKDIRVLVGNMEFYGDDINKLFESKEFMDKAKEKLAKAMESDIQDSIKEIKELKSIMVTKYRYDIELLTTKTNKNEKECAIII